MKLSKLFILFITVACLCKNAGAQNVLINILPQNAGMLSKNKSLFLEVTVCNTSATIPVSVYKLKPQISFPSELVNIPDTGHILPAGWKIISNTQGVIRISNGTDIIPVNECRTIFIAVEGKAIGGPSTILGSMAFSNGIAPGSASGSATPGDNPADNSSTSTIKVHN